MIEKQWNNTSYLKAIIVVGQMPIFHQLRLKNKLFFTAGVFLFILSEFQEI